MSGPQNLKIFSGSSHRAFAEAVAKELSVKLSEMTISRFACNEIYAKPSDSVRGADVFIIQTCTGNVNEDYMELFMMIDAMKRSFAGKVHVVIPHFGYARQDRVATPRESISAKVIANLLTAAGADHVITVHLHSDQTQGFFPFPVDNLNPRKIFAKYIEKKKLKNPIIVAPDAGAAKEAGRLVKLLDYPLAILTKNRPKFNVAEVTSVVGDIEGKTCIIFDDMIDTAGSVVAAHKALIDAGANKDIYLLSTHAVFSGQAAERLEGCKFKEVIVTDTVPIPVSKEFDGLTVLSIAPMLAKVIQSVHESRSVTDVM